MSGKRRQQTTCTIGIDLGGTKILGALADHHGKILHTKTVPTQAHHGPKQVVASIVAVIEALLAERDYTKRQLTAIGVGAPGQIDHARGLVIEPPNLPGWKRVPLKRHLQHSFHVPIYLENDANCAALGEYYYGAGKGCQEMIYMTISTGIGGGLILQGQLYRGARGAAGEVGHMVVLPGGPRCSCGNDGCLEAIASGTAIARRAQALLKTLRGKRSLLAKLLHQKEHEYVHVMASEMNSPTLHLPQSKPLEKRQNRNNNRFLDAALVATAARRGDPLAKEIYQEAGYYLGIGISNLANLLNPERIVLGGGVTKTGNLLLAPLRSAFAKVALHVPKKNLRILPAKLGGKTGVAGALALPRQSIRQKIPSAGV